MIGELSEEKSEIISKLTEQVVLKFKKSGYEVNPKEISKRLELLIFEFKVPESEAIKTVINYLMKELDVSREQLSMESPFTKIGEISKPNQWVSFKAKVVQLWDSGSPNVSQVGLIGDETGIIKFVTWAKAGKPEVKEGKSYLFRNVVTDSFGGRMQVNINRNSEIEEIAEDVELPPRELDVVGALIAIQQNSGLIQRCNECRRTISKGICPVHGKTAGHDDLRIKGVLDDGVNFYEIILNEDNIKSLTGIGLDEAKKIAEENLDRSAVIQTLRNKLLGKYMVVRGTKGERYLIVREIGFLKDEIGGKIDELIARLEGTQ